MPKLLLYYAHPAQSHSHANAEMYKTALGVDGLTCVDLYETYPRFNIRADIEQERLLAHDIVIFQFPMFWYSTPSILKEWQDIVLEHGFAYGRGGDNLAGKDLLLALTAGGAEEAYSTEGYQHFPLRDLVAPLEQTARLCQMSFMTPYVLHGSIKAKQDGRLTPHAEAYGQLLSALRDGTFDKVRAGQKKVLDYSDIVELIHVPQSQD